MRAVVFAGPSIHGLDSCIIEGVDLRAPAGQGDIIRAFNAGYRVFGLIDGFFESCLSVWHKEILWVLSQGGYIIGGASMGALRAAECHAYGMVGVGEVFHDYVSGRRTSDADVALSHASAELAHMPLTVAQVDIEATLEKLSSEGALPAKVCDRLLAASLGLHFAERTWRLVCEQAQLDAKWAGLVAALLPAQAVSVKQQDAALVLERLKAYLPTPDTNASAANDFVTTLYFEDLMKLTGAKNAG